MIPSQTFFGLYIARKEMSSLIESIHSSNPKKCQVQLPKFSVFFYIDFQTGIKAFIRKLSWHLKKNLQNGECKLNLEFGVKPLMKRVTIKCFMQFIWPSFFLWW